MGRNFLAQVYRDGSRFLPFGIKMGRNFCHQKYRLGTDFDKVRYKFSNSGHWLVY